jgi:hypothetical protein
MRVRLITCLTAITAAIAMPGCTNNEGPNYVGVPGAAWNGIYIQSIPDNLISSGSYDVLNVYVNYPQIEVVVTPNGSSTPAFIGSSATGLSDQVGVFRFSIPLTGTNGQTATATGYLTNAQSGPNAVYITITGGVTYSFNVPIYSASTNTLLAGSYSGLYTTSYTSGGKTTTEPAGTVSSITVKADSTSGGYDLSATGTTSDPTGAAVSFTISDAQVDSVGLISNLKVTYSYPGTSKASVTNTYPTAFIDLGLAVNSKGIQTNSTLVGYWSELSTNWPGSPAETDALLLTAASGSSKRPGRPSARR